MLMPGWKSLLALLAACAAVLIYFSFQPEATLGQMGRATLGLGWLAFGVAAIVRIILQLRRSRAKTTI
jgi:Na+/phosphate symporter